ncbi:MAG: bifunctional riboflavin kinase/FAD synthetase [Lachnospiraceae bacterium]|nr:bifunctional riboflavin kinase/FAD synthetase [Lachnospiraceae bacterium]
MKLITDIENLKLKNSIVTLGKFDGNHMGHQLLFETAISLKQSDYCTVIFTFDVSPAKVVGKASNASRTILTHEERHFQQYKDGIDYVVEFPFNKQTMAMSPEDFVKEILVDKLDVKVIVVGEDFCFGKNRSGNVGTLKELGKQYGFTVNAMKKVTYQPQDCDHPVEISSTLIKEEILKGHLEDVNKMLGAPFTMVGEILQGKKLGRTIGFPTINFDAPDEKILPPNGVYATRTKIKGKLYDSITNVGNRPTFDDGEFRNVETNIFDFDEDAYGDRAEVMFYKFIRPERKFDSADDLMKEIKRNKEEAVNFFKELDK